jgi:hypothetical protein
MNCDQSIPLIPMQPCKGLIPFRFSGETNWTIYLTICTAHSANLMLTASDKRKLWRLPSCNFIQQPVSLSRSDTDTPLTAIFTKILLLTLETNFYFWVLHPAACTTKPLFFRSAALHNIFKMFLFLYPLHVSVLMGHHHVEYRIT